MQPALPFDEPASAPAVLPAASLAPPLVAPPPVAFVRHPRARRYILRVLPDGTLRVTVPRWGTKRDARRFVEESHAWVARQRAARAVEAVTDRAWRDGGTVLVDGEAVALRVERGAGGTTVCIGDARLVASGVVPSDLRPLVERWLRARARVELPPALLALAARHGLTVTRVSVRNQQSRWGACARRGSITLNWRLLQVPPRVREYVLLHELMHLRELNHSSRFWRLVAAVCPDYQESRRWLRTEGHTLF